MGSELVPSESDLFEPWTDPESNVTSYRLDGPDDYQTFYFTNPPDAADGRYLWTYTAYPPARGHCLSVYDARADSLQAYPETWFEDASPHVDPDTGAVTWAAGSEFYRREPEPAATVTSLGGVTRQDVNGREVERIVTHIVPAADGRLNLDVHTPHGEGARYFLGAFDPVEGETNVWDAFPGPRVYNHSQFHPTRDLMLFAQDWAVHPLTGEEFGIDQRLWLADPDGAWPVFEEGRGRRAHEWWADDGEGIWYVDYDRGTEYYDLETGERSTVWPGGTCHSQASTDDRLLVGDVHTYDWESVPNRVAFYDRDTDTEIDIASALPRPPGGRMPHHVDPHPQFVCDDEFVAYTTTIGDGFTVALTPVDRLLERTR